VGNSFGDGRVQPTVPSTRPGSAERSILMKKSEQKMWIIPVFFLVLPFLCIEKAEVTVVVE
jgi:hypothetical protein